MVLSAGFAILLITSRTFNPPTPPLFSKDNREATVRHGLVAAALVYLGTPLHPAKAFVAASAGSAPVL